MLNKLLAEIFGTFMLVFIGGGSILLSEKYPHIFPAFCIPIAWGLTISVMIWVVGGVSGAHFNPAVTLAFAVAKRFPPAQVLTYWASQLLGGILAVGLLTILQKK